MRTSVPKTGETSGTLLLDLQQAVGWLGSLNVFTPKSLKHTVTLKVALEESRRGADQQAA